MRQGGSTEGFWMVEEGQEAGRQGGCGAVARSCAVSGNEKIQIINTRISKVTQRLKVPKGNTSCTAMYTM